MASHHFQSTFVIRDATVPYNTTVRCTPLGPITDRKMKRVDHRSRKASTITKIRTPRRANRILHRIIFIIIHSTVMGSPRRGGKKGGSNFTVYAQNRIKLRRFFLLVPRPDMTGSLLAPPVSKIRNNRGPIWAIHQKTTRIKLAMRT